MDQVLQQFRDRITSATRSGTALRIRGNGTKDWYGQELAGELLDTTAYSGIVSYDPTELVITARAGTNLREIGKALAEKKQMLALSHLASMAWPRWAVLWRVVYQVRAVRQSVRCVTSCWVPC